MSSKSTGWILGATAAFAGFAACALSTEGTMPPPAASTTAATGTGGMGGDIGFGGNGGFEQPTGGGGGGGAGGGAPCNDPVWGQRLSFTPELQRMGVAADGNGNVVTATGFTGDTDITGTMLSAVGGTDVLVTKHNSDGGLVWAKGFGPSGGSNDWAEAVAVDSTGNVHITGVTAGSIDFGGGAVGPGAFVVALNESDGSHRWSDALPNTEGHAIAVDTTGAAIVAGHFDGAFMDGGMMTDFGGMDDAIVSKFDSNGVRQWVRPWGDDKHQYALGVALNAANSIFVTGEFEGTLDLTPGDPSDDLVNPDSSYDAFLVALNAAGGLLWGERFGGTGYQSGRAIAVDTTGAIIVAGGFADTIDIDGDMHTSAGLEDIFVAKFNIGGTLVWAKHFGDASDQLVSAVAVGPNNQIYLAGSFYGTLDFGAGPILRAGNKSNFFAAVLNADGSAVWSASFGADGKNEHAAGVAASGCSVLLCGTFDNVFSAGPVDFPDGGGGYESFVLKIHDGA